MPVPVQNPEGPRMKAWNLCNFGLYIALEQLKTVLILCSQRIADVMFIFLLLLFYSAQKPHFYCTKTFDEVIEFDNSFKILRPFDGRKKP